MNMKVRVLGNCANQTDSRECVNLVVSTDSQKILVDAGPGVVKQLYRSGLCCSDIGSVIVTHSHGDHVLGYPYFIFGHFYDRLNGKIGPDVIHVYASESICAGLDAMLRFCYVPDNYPFRIEYHPIGTESRTEFSVGEVQVVSAPVDHTTPTVGLSFMSSGRKLAYSSDTLLCEEDIFIAKDADLLIHEGFVTKENEALALKVKHATAEMAGLVASSAGARSLALVHIFPPYIGRETELVREASGVYQGCVVVPDELSQLDV